MADEPVVLTHHVEPQIQEAASAALPAPSREQEQLADGVFSREQEQAAALLVGMQAGIAIAHHLALETFVKDDDDEEEEPRRRPEPEAR